MKVLLLTQFRICFSVSGRSSRKLPSRQIQLSTSKVKEQICYSDLKISQRKILCKRIRVHPPLTELFCDLYRQTLSPGVPAQMSELFPEYQQKIIKYHAFFAPSQKSMSIKQKAPSSAVPLIFGIFKIVLCAGKILTDKLRTLVQDLLYLLLAHAGFAETEDLVGNVLTGVECNHHCLHCG